MTHDPGGKVRLALPQGTTSTVIWGGRRREYRHYLSRCWSTLAPASRLGSVLFVMMNPSMADHDVDDPTVAKCGRFVRRWGFSSLLVGNVFGYRATDQAQLAAASDPVGEHNDKWLRIAAREASLIVMAYGTPRVPALRARGLQVAQMLDAEGHVLHVLRLSKAGVPCHPLYLPETLQPVVWDPYLPPAASHQPSAPIRRGDATQKESSDDA